ncbi:MAG: signal peptide peptidase SppA [Deltaproteobacteria bacterium]|jgi:protease-4|nr:signal peptide peptidase SppA [Deltaproteobacteria bacterium]
MSQYPYAAPPFRKRRPLLFVFLCLLLLGLLFAAASAVFGALAERGAFSGPRLGVIKVEGFIGDAERTVRWIERLRRDKTVAGALVRVDSPGGAVAPSQEVFSALQRLAKEKPVVVSMGTAAASGGYYIAVAGREIFANPSTLTGSIGVRLQLTNVQGLMERLGVSSESLTTGKFKATGSPFQAMTPEERAYLQGILADMQEEFVNAVAVGRSLPREAVTAIADGRVLTGRQALAAKLVDHLGDREAALARLQTLCSLEGEAELLLEPERSKPWWKLLLEAAMDLEAGGSTDAARYMFCY